MADKRCVSKQVVDSDSFLDLPTSSRLLYYDLIVRADDDGVVSSPKKIIRFTGASEDDLKLLAMKKFIIPLGDGLIVVKHWKIHNNIRKDMYKPSNYSKYLEGLYIDENKAYSLTPQVDSVTSLLQTCNEPVTNLLQGCHSNLNQSNSIKDNINKSNLIEFKSIEDGLTEEQIETLMAEIPFYDLLILYIDKRIKEMPKNPFNYILACAKKDEWRKEQA